MPRAVAAPSAQRNVSRPWDLGALFHFSNLGPALMCSSHSQYSPRCRLCPLLKPSSRAACADEPTSILAQRLLSAVPLSGRRLMPVQLKQKRPCEGLRAEHPVFDHPPLCAPIRCCDRDHPVLHDIPARYAFAAIFHAHFFIHNDDPLSTPAVSPFRQVGDLATKEKALALESNQG